MSSKEEPEHRYARVYYKGSVDIVFMLSYRGGNWQLFSKNWPKDEITVKRCGESLRWTVTINGDAWDEDFKRLTDAAKAVSNKYHGVEQ